MVTLYVLHGRGMEKKWESTGGGFGSSPHDQGGMTGCSIHCFLGGLLFGSRIRALPIVRGLLSEGHLDISLSGGNLSIRPIPFFFLPYAFSRGYQKRKSSSHHRQKEKSSWRPGNQASSLSLVSFFNFFSDFFFLFIFFAHRPSTEG